MTDRPEDRYLRDPIFHQFVDMVENLLNTCDMSPSEIREAAMLGCIHYDLRHVKLRFIFEPHVKTSIK